MHHRTFVLSGRLHLRLNDGTEAEVGAGDVVVIPPGHDAWVVGDEPVVAFDFDEGSKDYAKASD
jgi:quercetin dioxygenase-like cupin family protein